MLNETLVARLRARGHMSQLAKEAGFSRFDLSRLLWAHNLTKARDPRLKKLGKLVGLPAKDVFRDGGA